MVKAKPTDTNHVRVSIRLTRDVWESMRQATASLGLKNPGEVTRHLLMIGLQASSASAAAVRGAASSQEILEVFKVMMTGETPAEEPASINLDTKGISRNGKAGKKGE